MIYEGGTSSRIYEGTYRVRTTYALPDGSLEYDETEAMSYEECEARCHLHGTGVGFDTAGFGLPPVVREVRSSIIERVA